MLIKETRMEVKMEFLVVLLGVLVTSLLVIKPLIGVIVLVVVVATSLF